jgi:hypothetical protein
MVLALAGCDGSPREESEAMELAIQAFASGKPVPARFTCDGADLSPALQWSDPPAGTRSFALIVDDPDAPGGVFSHWGAYDIAASARGLDEGAGNAAHAPFRQAQNDFGVQGYRGPCPPRGHGVHRYRFKLLALDVVPLEVGPAPRVGELERAAGAHVLGHASVTATYGRN